MLWLAPLLGFALTVPSLASGYVQDDHCLRQHSIETSIFTKRPSWDFFNWLSSAEDVAHHREQGAPLVNWWTPDSARSRLFRPVTSLLHAFEFSVWGEAPWVMHLNRALLYALIVFLCARLLLRFSSTPVAFGIACFVFAIDDVHAYSAGWISAANALLACALGLFALLMHDDWRRSRSIGRLVLSAASFTLCLLSSEGGLALLGYIVAHGLFVEQGTWQRRIASLLPAVLIAAGYLVFYVASDLGVKGSFDYLAPGENILQTALVVLRGTVTGTFSQLLSIMPIGWALNLSAAAVFVAAVLLAGFVALFWRFLTSNRRAAFFAVGMVLSVVPFTLGMMSDRSLVWASLGAAGLVGELLAVHKPISRPQRIVARTMAATHTVVSLLFFVPTLFWLAIIEGNIRKLEDAIPSGNTVVLNAHPIAVMTAAAIRGEKGRLWPDHLYLLYDGLERLTVTRTGERTLLATAPNGWFSSSFVSRASRPRDLHFSHGQTFGMQLMTVTVDNLTEDGRPLSVRFDFKKDLSEFEWLHSALDGPRKTRVPARGEVLQVNPWARE